MNDFQENRSDAPPVDSVTVTGRYTSVGDRQIIEEKASDPNWRKLKTIAVAFGLTPTQIAAAASVSRPYASRLLNLHDPLRGSPAFWRRLESRLGALVEHRTAQVFQVPAVPVEEEES